MVRLHTLEALSAIAQHAGERPSEHAEWFATVKEGALVKLMVECLEGDMHTQVCLVSGVAFNKFPDANIS